MGHNKKIDFDAKAFIAVTDSVHLLKKLKFDSIFVDEAHHPLPPKMPGSTELYRLSATHKAEPDFRYTMGQAIEDGILCDYDITVPALTAHHAYVCLGDLLLKQVGRFRRVLAYCTLVAEATLFRTLSAICMMKGCWPDGLTGSAMLAKICVCHRHTDDCQQTHP